MFSRFMYNPAFSCYTQQTISPFHHCTSKLSRLLQFNSIQFIKNTQQTCMHQWYDIWI